MLNLLKYIMFILVVRKGNKIVLLRYFNFD